MKGIFRRDYNTLISLPGIGPYTAAAIASIAGNHPTPVVDGNVFRVATRYFGIYDDIGDTGTGKQLVKIIGDMIPSSSPGDFNQAIMELGATICTPRKPDCHICPWQVDCYARREKTIEELPVKKKKTKVRTRNLHYFVLENNGHLHLIKRSTNDIWGGMYDFPAIETPSEISTRSLEILYQEQYNEPATVEESSTTYSHKLSHQNIRAVFHRISSGNDQTSDKNWFTADEVENLPKSVLLQKYLNDHSI
jgi:A/G-specific adenine glycosylase